MESPAQRQRSAARRRGSDDAFRFFFRQWNFGCIELQGELQIGILIPWKCHGVLPCIARRAVVLLTRTNGVEQSIKAEVAERIGANVLRISSSECVAAINSLRRGVSTP